MKRLALTLLLLLILGAILNVAVAWSCGLLQPSSSDPRPTRTGVLHATTTTDKQNWDYSIFVRGTCEAVWWTQRREAVPEAVLRNGRPNTKAKWYQPPPIPPSAGDRYSQWDFIELAEGWP